MKTTLAAFSTWAIVFCGLAVCASGCVESDDDDGTPDEVVKGMVEVPGGGFLMGCNDAVDDLCLDDEFPYHTVDVSTFWIDEFEVTADEYMACTDASGCSVAETGNAWNNCNLGIVDREDHPINCVTWYQAVDYCAWVGKRLPTEAEWEKAARGTDGRMYPWGNETPTCDHAVIAWAGCSFQSSTEPVGSRPLGASPYGAQDMAGNVWEWVEDWYHETYDGAPTDGSAWVVPEDTRRVVRGGSWNEYYLSNDLRTSHRRSDMPEHNNAHLGFRCVQ